MALQQITIEIPDKVLLAVKTDAESFGRENRMLGVSEIAATALPLRARIPSHSHLSLVGGSTRKAYGYIMVFSIPVNTRHTSVVK
jgi:hypothetical protein